MVINLEPYCINPISKIHPPNFGHQNHRNDQRNSNRSEDRSYDRRPDYHRNDHPRHGRDHHHRDHHGRDYHGRDYHGRDSRYDNRSKIIDDRRGGARHNKPFNKKPFYKKPEIKYRPNYTIIADDLAEIFRSDEDDVTKTKEIG